LSFTPGSSRSLTLTVTSTAFTASGVYTVVVTGRTGILTHTASITFTVLSDFTVSASPTNPANIVASNSATSTLTVGSLGLTGNISLTASSPSGSNIVPSLSTSSLAVTPGSTGSSTLTIATSPSTPSNTYNIVVTLRSGSLTHTISVSIMVKPDFTISATS